MRAMPSACRSRHGVSRQSPARSTACASRFTPDWGFAAVHPRCARRSRRRWIRSPICGATLVPLPCGLDPDILERVLKPIGYTEQAAAVACAHAGGAGAVGTANSRTSSRRAAAIAAPIMSRRCIVARRLRNHVAGLFSGCDVVVTPTVAVTAFAAGELGVDEIDGQRGRPSISAGRRSRGRSISRDCRPPACPADSTATGLPIGLQLVGPMLGEPVLFRVAAAFEAARPWVRPPAADRCDEVSAQRGEHRLRRSSRRSSPADRTKCRRP